MEGRNVSSWTKNMKKRTETGEEGMDLIRQFVREG